MNIKPIAFTALALTALTATGQKTWTLEECVDYAMQHNITLKKNAQAEALSTVEVDRTAPFAQCQCGARPHLSPLPRDRRQYGERRHCL